MVKIALVVLWRPLCHCASSGKCTSGCWIAVRGGTKSPGEFRTSQNWIGGTRPGNAMFVPPPPNEVMTCLGDWERFIHEDTPSIPPLVKAGLIHVQFETIHPF